MLLSTPKTLFAYQKELNYSGYLLDKCDERSDLDEKGVWTLRMATSRLIWTLF